MNKEWKIYEVDEKKVEEISSKYNLNKLISTILANRNITTEEEIRLFLSPTRKDFHNPFLITDMEKSVERIIKAIENKEKVTIYGDYDVDGITSITVLKSFLKDRGLETSQYIPNRLNEGYGLNNNAIEKIKQQGCDLMITVDCGISAINEINYASSLGIETIITDHHEPGNEIPKAFAVIDNKRKDSKYPFRELAGVGVVFKLIQAIGIKLGLKEEEYLKYLDIVCVGTISDIVPLVDENRVIAKLGLMLIRQTRNIGLKSIIDTSGYTKIDSNSISFGIAPRINACGRMGKAEDALELFLSKNYNEVSELAKKLNDYNKLRQDTEKEIYENAIKQIEQNKLDKNNSIIVGGHNWHHGVIGIVSSKITEMYFKPSILLSFEEDGIGTGSGRSIPGFDLHEALTKCLGSVEKFGGHSMAVGLTVKKEKFEEFKKEFEQIATKSNVSEIIPVINIDAKIDFSAINKDMVESLKQLEPFGEGNKMPVFVFKNLKIDSIRALSEGKHLKLTLKEGNTVVNAIGFNIGNLADEYIIGDKIDVVGVLEVNNFNGVESLQINIKDIMRTV
ncbi:MAG: single-stranded-DNA-specific exonuclease RecJ [Clostridia bacterium]|nr:single-stranded-DNA-specific exonuclease RecJ [Clostridium sp.]MBS6252911.1 single-stranded-DNA-specific exonuclease RecJ [Clostridium sp.]